MNQKIDKPISEFTEKQRKSYKVAMKALSKQNLGRRKLYSLMKEADIYQSDRDVKEVVKMLERNPNTPISVEKGRLVNELREASRDL